jgi:hypothetical protein
MLGHTDKLWQQWAHNRMNAYEVLAMVGSHQTMLGMASNTKRRCEGFQGMLGSCKENATSMMKTLREKMIPKP